VAVGVALHLVQAGQVLGIEAQDQALGDDGHAVPAAVAQALDDGAGQGVHERLEAHPLARELLGDEGDGGPHRLADAEGQVAGLASHRDHEVPAGRRVRVHHEVLDDVDAEVPRGLEAEGVDPGRQVGSLSMVFGTCTTAIRPADCWARRRAE
jgi:hypothetical protein